MVKIDTKEYWACARCGSEHGFREEALECCTPRKVIMYVCGKCENEYEESQEAEDCCKEDG